jgi:hypothetical protein
MKIDKIPTHKITAKAVEYSIFTGKKYCFANVDMLRDFSWDGEQEKIDWINKAESVLFSKKELEAFCPSRGVHEFLLELNKARKEEIKRLKREMKTAKTFWIHSKYKWIKDSKLVTSENREQILKNWSCNPKQMLKDRIEFLESNDIRFVEINFK